jgi:hypothetical protein
MPTAKRLSTSKNNGRRDGSATPKRLESLKQQYRLLETLEDMDKFLSQLTLDELRAIAKNTRRRNKQWQTLLRRRIIKAEYQSLKTDKARDKFLAQLSSPELHALMVSMLDVDLLKERLGL